jgi:hypothetical protein
MYRRHHVILYVLAVLAGAAALTIGPPGSPAASGPLPTHEYTAPPNNWDACEGSSSSNWYSKAYRRFTSAATPAVGPNGRDRGRVLDFTGRAGRTWWLLASFRVQEGSVGRLLNMHDVAGDTYWGGVSPWAVDFLGTDYVGRGGSSGITLSLEDEQRAGRVGQYSIVPASAFRYGARYDLVIRIVFGRKDASDSAARGATTIWVNGSETPAVDVQNVNTVYDNQHWLQFWEGVYHPSSRSLGGPGRLQMSATRFGRTLADALRDGTSEQPITDLGTVGCDTVYKQGSGLADLGGARAGGISSWDIASFQLPTSLGGGGAAPEPAPAPAPAPAPQAPPAAAPPGGDGGAEGARPARRGTAGGSGTNGPAPDAASAVAELLESSGGVVWDGQLFRSPGTLKRHLDARRVDWTSFLDKHPAVVSVYELPFVRWAGKRFYTQDGLRRQLQAAGADLQAWVRVHAQAWADLAASESVPSRTIASVQTGPGRVVWHDRIFLRPSSLRAHLRLGGLGWQRFLERHADVVAAFSLPSVTWDGKAFYTKAALTRWLGERGKSYEAWAAARSELASRLQD